MRAYRISCLPPAIYTISPKYKFKNDFVLPLQQPPVDYAVVDCPPVGRELFWRVAPATRISPRRPHLSPQIAVCSPRTAFTHDFMPEDPTNYIAHTPLLSDICSSTKSFGCKRLTFFLGPFFFENQRFFVRAALLYGYRKHKR